jgi:protein subunit release factor A
VSNFTEARQWIIDQLSNQTSSMVAGSIAEDRRAQVGSGMRADKILTIRFQDDTAQYHGTGKSMSAKDFMAGKMDRLW